MYKLTVECNKNKSSAMIGRNQRRILNPLFYMYTKSIVNVCDLLMHFPGFNQNTVEHKSNNIDNKRFIVRCVAINNISFVFIVFHT